MTQPPAEQPQPQQRQPDQVEAEQPEPRPVAAATVEEVVRAQLAKALGGRRGMAEAAVPTILFTLSWLTLRDLQLALGISIGAALVLLAVRLVQRSTVQFVVNALLGIGIGWYFVHRSAASGGSAEDQALAYFLPGLLYNGGYAVVLALTCLVGWPLVGFMVGSITGDATAWHGDRQVVRLCSRLTWLLALPCALRVAVQAPIWLAGSSGSMDADAAVAALGVLKIVLGWPLQLAALGTMVWLLSRNRTPVAPGVSGVPDAPSA
ncbi:DUF3159 domain-containing protein [Nocardioides zeicaulis]|uniref:DUF3159 domain-containing protein n=1 Tax=Nocardioides zeicaulis TaxID=1776857 RepID=A0ABV6E6U5_9ACTN